MSLSKLHPVIELPLPATIRVDDAASSQAVKDDVVLLFDECATGLRRYLGSFGLGAEATEDVLQETPEFLEETPEHDRLWFEQKPPKDFDLD